ncbi:MAG: hypothetical protein KKH98_07410 [Spirochaetes bacterium]|nr:hypothetical protein [Spirochaetota bacterium]
MTKILLKHLKSRLFETFTEHTLITGKSGSGKSNSAEYLLTQNVGKYKCIDLYDDGRGESMTYSIPESDQKLIRRMEDLSLFSLVPKSFDNDIIMLAGERADILKKELPEQVKICSIDQNDITLEDLKFLLASTESAGYAIDMLRTKLGNLTLDKIYDALMVDNPKDDDYIKGMGTVKYSILRNLSKWLDSPLFDTKKYPPVNFQKTFADKKKITSFSTYLQEDEDSKALIYGLILKKIFYSKRNKRIKSPIVTFIREISNLAGRNKISTHYQMAERFILRTLREGRDYGCYIIADTQRGRDILPIMRRNFGIHIAMRQDLQEVKDYLLELQEIDTLTLRKIPHLKRGEAIIATGVDYFYPVFFPPTQHHHKKEKENIFKLLKENGNTS